MHFLKILHAVQINRKDLEIFPFSERFSEFVFTKMIVTIKLLETMEMGGQKYHSIMLSDTGTPGLPPPDISEITKRD